jgi:hypothetical protein
MYRSRFNQDFYFLSEHSTFAYYSISSNFHFVPERIRDPGVRPVEVGKWAPQKRRLTMPDSASISPRYAVFPGATSARGLVPGERSVPTLTDLSALKMALPCEEQHWWTLVEWMLFIFPGFVETLSTIEFRIIEQFLFFSRRTDHRTYHSMRSQHYQRR